MTPDGPPSDRILASSGDSDNTSAGASGPGSTTRPGIRPESTAEQRRLLVIFGGLAVLGLVIGSGAGLVVNAVDDPEVLTGALPAASPTPTLSASATPTETVAPTSTETPEPTADDPADRDALTDESSPSTPSEPDYSEIPTNVSADSGLDFGFLTEVVRTDGTVSLRFDRAVYHAGADAARYNQGKLPKSGYLIENTNSTLRSFRLDPKASVVGANRLLAVPGQVGQETMTVTQFVDRSTRAFGSGPAVLPVWLRHTDGMGGPVTAIAEQYLP